MCDGQGTPRAVRSACRRHGGFLTALVSSSGSTTLDSHSYTRDAVGNPTQEVIGGLTASTSSFGYDDLYRPTSATDATGVYSWSYDADNNRLSQTLNGQPTSYTVDSANRLTSVGGTPVTTDANGNLLVDANGNQYHWDARGRLVSITKNGTTLASYTYATNGIRTSATEGGVTTNFTLDGTLCVNEAVGSSNTASMFGPTGVLCRGTQWFTPTANGSIGSVTDNSGNAVAQNRYGVFGQVTTTNPNSGDPLQFLGGMSDASTGLDYLGSGFYVCLTGRAERGRERRVAPTASVICMWTPSPPPAAPLSALQPRSWTEVLARGRQPSLRD